MMINIQNNSSRLPVQVNNELADSANVITTSTSSNRAQRRHATTPSRSSLLTSHNQQTLKSLASRKHYLNRAQYKRQLALNQQQQQPKIVQSKEYKNLRQVVPSLRRQKDVGKVEVVTEAARYIDHLHKTLIERFVLCGIPESLKGKF